MAHEMKELSGRTALVTGGGRNIGREIVLALASAGANVVVNVRSNQDEADQVCRAARDLGVEAMPILADLADPEAIRRMFAEVEDSLGNITVLVNSAAVRPEQSIFDITERDWDWVVGVGLKGAFFCAQSAARMMIAEGWGRIINISGRDGFAGRANRAHGVTVKAGIHGLTRALAVELGPHGITANSVVPGVTRTTRPPEWYSDLDYDKRAAQIPVRRVGTPADIARACVFLATDPGYVNGIALHVNGGQSLFS